MKLDCTGTTIAPAIGRTNRRRTSIPIKTAFAGTNETIRIFVAMTAGIMFLCAGLTGCKKETPLRTVTEEQIDQRLTEEVKVALGNSPAFKFPDVHVAAFKGNVQLSGFVLSDDQKSSAETIAKGVPGVAKVENSIALKH